VKNVVCLILTLWDGFHKDHVHVLSFAVFYVQVFQDAFSFTSFYALNGATG